MMICPRAGPSCSAYFDGMVERELVDTEAAQDVIGALRDPAAPPLRWLRDGVWRLVRWPYARAGALATIGLAAACAARAARRPLERLEAAPLPGADAPLEGLRSADAAAGEELRAANYLRWRGPAIAR